MIEASEFEVKVIDSLSGSHNAIVISGDDEQIHIRQDGDHIYCEKGLINQLIKAIRKTAKDT